MVHGTTNPTAQAALQQHQDVTAALAAGMTQQQAAIAALLVGSGGGEAAPSWQLQGAAPTVC